VVCGRGLNEAVVSLTIKDKLAATLVAVNVVVAGDVSAPDFDGDAFDVIARGIENITADFKRNVNPARSASRPSG
jgi:hypothetical protein